MTKFAKRKLLMIPLALLAAGLGGCISRNPEKFDAQLREWVPVGMKETKAEKVMTKKGFECTLVGHGTVFNTNDVDYLDCVREQVWFHDWDARIILKDGKVIGYGPTDVK